MVYLHYSWLVKDKQRSISIIYNYLLATMAQYLYGNVDATLHVVHLSALFAFNS